MTGEGDVARAWVTFSATSPPSLLSMNGEGEVARAWVTFSATSPPSPLSMNGEGEVARAWVTSSAPFPLLSRFARHLPPFWGKRLYPCFSAPSFPKMGKVPDQRGGRKGKSARNAAHVHKIKAPSPFMERGFRGASEHSCQWQESAAR